MKFLKSISLFCLIVLLVFLLCLFVFDRNSFVVERNKIENTLEKETDLSVTTKQNVTTCDTLYKVELYVGSDYKNVTESIPFAFIGLTREELLDELDRYEMSPNFTDKQNGFVSIDLLSFHPEEIVVKKVYEEEQEKIIYYLKAVNHELIVYRSDQEEAYMPTDLTLEMLPPKVQQEVIHIKCFNDIREVYDFLESYTS